MANRKAMKGTKMTDPQYVVNKVKLKKKKKRMKNFSLWFIVLVKEEKRRDDVLLLLSVSVSLRVFV